MPPPNGQANFWLSADFQTAYDPCVCHYPTNIKLDFEYFSTTSLKLYGRGISTQEDLINSSGNIINNDFLGGVDFSSQMNAENGFVIYKNMTRLVDDYYDRLLDYETSLSTVQQDNDKVERNLAIIKVGKIVLSSGIAAVTGTTELTSLITLLPNINAWDSIGQKTFWKELDKVLFEGLDLLVKENFTKQSVPQAPSTPTASFSEMYFEGILENNLLINGPQFHTPGSFLNNNDSIFNATNSVFSYPVYNNPLGVFALMEQPKIEISNSLILPESCANSIITLGNYANVTQTYSHYRNVQFKLKNPLKYAFNSALDIENYSIEGSVIIEFETESGNSQVDSSEYLSGYFINANSHNYPGVYANDKKGVFQVNSVPIPLDGILDFTSQFTSQHTRKKYFSIHTSQLDELSTICDDNIDEINHSDYTRPNVKKAFLRLSVDVEYNDQKSNGDPHQYNYIFTYEIDLDGGVHYSSSPIVQNLILSPINLSQYEYDLELNGVNFNGQNINGCALENNLYLCKAENNVTLQGAFTVAPGYEVIVQATNEINVLPEASLPPEMILQIAPFIDLNSPMPPATSDYVSNFCQQTNGYQANVAKTSGKSLNEDDVTEKSTSIQHEEFEFNLYPNPTSGGATVNFSIPESATGNLYVTDINGRVLLNQFSDKWLSSGRQEQYLSTENLPFGIYLVVLQIDGVPHVKRLIKN